MAATSGMIRMVMLGRTGNNLFQYALGRALAVKHGVPLVMDASWFNAEGWQSVSCIQRFGLPMRIRRRGSLGSRALRKLKGRHPWEYLGIPVMKERVGSTGFADAFMDAPADVVLLGYFQSPRYFAAIEESIRRELDLNQLEWDGSTSDQADLLSESESVAVHVRRTDFIGSTEFEVCGEGYYRKAMARLRERLPNPRFHMFSDDPEWCLHHLYGDDVEVASNARTSRDPLHDLYLMSCCRHHIIANSSYSWWAAWLGRRLGQRVISPDRWFGGEIKAPMEDRLLEGWEMLEVND